MTHEEVKNRFSELLEESLSESETRDIESHLDECGECREAWDDFRKTFESFRVMVGAKAPPRLAERIKKRIYRRSRGKFFQEPFPLLFRVPYELFSLVLILVALIMFMVLSGIYDVGVDQSPKDGGQDEMEQIVDETPGTGDPLE
ncbi:MAG: zf-HC2 domain-containing protein [Pseudomonadota bacterium]